METTELLAAFTTLMNKHGVDSKEAYGYLQENRQNEEFFELATLARNLKRSIQTPQAE